MNDTLQTHVQRSPRSLIKQLRRRIFISVAILVFFLLLSSGVGIYISWSQQQFGDQRVATHDNVSGLLQATLDEETGLRGYIATNDTTFLQPLTSGRADYATYLKKLKATADGDSFQHT